MMDKTTKRYYKEFVSSVKSNAFGKYTRDAIKNWFDRTFTSEEVWDDVCKIIKEKDTLTKEAVKKYVEKYRENPFVMPLLLECNNIDKKEIKDLIERELEKEYVTKGWSRDKTYYSMINEILAVDFPPLIRNICKKDLMKLYTGINHYRFQQKKVNEKIALDIAKEVFYNLSYDEKYLGVLSSLKPYNTLTEEKLNQEFNKMLTHKWSSEEMKNFTKLEKRQSHILENAFLDEPNTNLVLANGEIDYLRTGEKMTLEMADELYDVIVSSTFDSDTYNGGLYNMFRNLTNSGHFNYAKQYDLVSRLVSTDEAKGITSSVERLLNTYVGSSYWNQKFIDYNPCAIKMLMNSNIKNIECTIFENPNISDEIKLSCMDDCLKKIKKEKIRKSKGRFMTLIKHLGELVTLDDARYEEILKHMDSPDDSYKSIKNKSKFQEMVIEIASSPKTPLKYLEEFQKRNETNIEIRIAKYGNEHNLTKKQTDALFFATERCFAGNVGKTIKNIEFLEEIFNCDKLATEQIDLINYINTMLDICNEKEEFGGYKQNLLELRKFAEKYIVEYKMDKDMFLKTEYPSQYFTTKKTEFMKKISETEYNEVYANNDITKNMVKYFDEYVVLRKEKDELEKAKREREKEIIIDAEEKNMSDGVFEEKNINHSQETQKKIINPTALSDITDFEDEIIKPKERKTETRTVELIDFDEER